MQQNFQDVMAIVCKFGKLDLFLTFTCNPTWTEILENLMAKQYSSDRPDIVCRVFRQKLKSFMSDIINKNVLGTVKGWICVIEIQKRGLPHCHALFFLEHDSKLTQPCDVDTAISAEILIPAEDPSLFHTVKSCMVHGPCGTVSPTAPCMGSVQKVIQSNSVQQRLYQLMVTLSTKDPTMVVL